MRRVIVLGLLAFLMGHDHGGCGGSDGAPTKATCDPRLTWNNFGQGFTDRYCTKCHATSVHGGERRGAPGDHNYDTVEGVRKDLDHLDQSAASGPAAENDFMPPYGPMPTQLEREQLGQWLACGAP
jgi:hypothetical protein